MNVPRAVALVLLFAIAGGLGLPWIGGAHQFNDDPHWAVAYRAGDGGGPEWTTGRPADDTHCEICHWLRTMRTASRPAPITVSCELRSAIPSQAPDPRTRAASLRSLSARAPPIHL